MEKKKQLTWDERHPFGNLRYYTFLDNFVGVTSLEETASKVALRVLKHHLEEALGFELSDEEMAAISALDRDENMTGTEENAANLAVNLKN